MTTPDFVPPETIRCSVSARRRAGVVMRSRGPAVILLAIATSASLAIAGWSPEFRASGFNDHGYPTSATVFENHLVVAGDCAPRGMRKAGAYSYIDGLWEGPFQTLRGIWTLHVHDNRLYAGGEFRPDRDKPSHALRVWSGEAWESLPVSLVGEVHALTTWRGDLVAGGRFWVEGHDEIAHLARWDGTAWRAIGGGVSSGGITRVQALAIVDDDLYVGGVFGKAGESPARNIACWNGQDWQALGAGADRPVTALVEHEGRLYAGGLFETLGDALCAAVGSWNGSAWHPMSGGISGTGVRGQVHALAIWNGALVVGGRFDQAGATPAASVAMWTQSGWQAMGAGFEIMSTALSLRRAVTHFATLQGRLFAVGDLSRSGDRFIGGVAEWRDGGWHPLPEGPGLHNCPSQLVTDDVRAGIAVNRSTEVAPIRGLSLWRDGAWTHLPTQDEIVRVRNPLDTVFRFVDGEILTVAGPDYGQPGIGSYVARWNSATGTLVAVTARLPAERLVPSDLMVSGSRIYLVAEYTQDGVDHIHGVFAWDGAAWSEHRLGQGHATIGSSCLHAGHPVVSIQFMGGNDIRQPEIRELRDGIWYTLPVDDALKVTALLGREDELLAAFAAPLDPSTVGAQLRGWDGSAWSEIPGRFHTKRDTLGGRISTMADYRGHLVVSGNFTGVDGVTCGGPAYLENGTWLPLVRKGLTQIQDMAATDDALWICGTFEEIDGLASSHIARWDGPLPQVDPDTLPPAEIEPPKDRIVADGWHSHGLDRTEAPVPFRNGTFADWDDDGPTAWQLKMNRCRDLDPATCMTGIPGGGLHLAVPDTGCSSLGFAQRFAVDPGLFYRCRVRYRYTPAGNPEKRCPRLTLADYSVGPRGYEFGPLHGGMTVPLDSEEEAWAEITLRMDEDKTELAACSIWSIGAGSSLDLYEIDVDTLTLSPPDCMEALLDRLESSYVPLDGRTLDWESLRSRFAIDPADVDTLRDFQHQTTEMMTEFQDPWITISSTEADVTNIGLLGVSDDRSRIGLGISRARRFITDLPYYRGSMILGWTEDDIVYLGSRFGSISALDPWDLKGAKGLIIDLQTMGSMGLYNHELNHPPDHETASPFTTIRCPYAKILDLTADGWSVSDTLWVVPAETPAPDIPIVCLIGPGTRGIVARLAMWLAAGPNTTLIGQPASPSPARRTPIPVPYGFQVVIPTGRIVPLDAGPEWPNASLTPDIFTAQDEDDPDATLDTALAYLRALIAADAASSP